MFDIFNMGHRCDKVNDASLLFFAIPAPVSKGDHRRLLLMGNRGQGLFTCFLVMVLLAVASCGANGGGEHEIAEPIADASVETSPQAPSSTAETQPEVTAASASQAPTTDSAPKPDGPPAPDFSLDLSGGETFVLSQQTTPVLIFFWAEW